MGVLSERPAHLNLEQSLSKEQCEQRLHYRNASERKHCTFCSGTNKPAVYGYLDRRLLCTLNGNHEHRILLCFGCIILSGSLHGLWRETQQLQEEWANYVSKESQITKPAQFEGFTGARPCQDEEEWRIRAKSVSITARIWFYFKKQYSYGKSEYLLLIILI